ncbi:hypothetical protein AB1K70_26080, partial [Bremerella sp. JC770]|uniref:hypothetical protein n=1 Tax=Bremerella sp. JC770 TaxID=3232137 RepID=UPI003458F217
TRLEPAMNEVIQRIEQQLRNQFDELRTQEEQLKEQLLDVQEVREQLGVTLTELKSKALRRQRRKQKCSHDEVRGIIKAVLADGKSLETSELQESVKDQIKNCGNSINGFARVFKAILKTSLVVEVTPGVVRLQDNADLAIPHADVTER